VARRIRIQYAGALYHVVSRGNRNGLLFADDSDRESFLKALDEARRKTLWRIHAYVLMPDHFHLILKTPEANLVAGMQWFLGTYTSRFNVRHGLRGHLFAGRYKATPIDPRGPYLQTALDYVHLNPARAKLIRANQPLREFPWSSFGSYLAPSDARRNRPVVEPVLTGFGAGGAGRNPARGFERHMEGRRTLDLNREFQGLRHGWFFGAESFRAELLARMDSAPGAHLIGPEIHESAEAKAERIVTRELALLDWSEQELRERAKGDFEKIRIAEQLRLESTMTINWIAERLRMGTTGYLSHLLYWRRRGGKPARRGGAGMARASIPKTRSESTPPPAGRPGGQPMPVGPGEAPIPSGVLQPFTFDPSFD
jgi:REP element-mobilizing transposase RayT